MISSAGEKWHVTLLIIESGVIPANMVTPHMFPPIIRSQHWRKEETGQEYSLLFLSYTKSGCFLHSRVMDSLPLILGFIVTLSSTERVANWCLSCWCLRKGWSLEEQSLMTTEAGKHAESCVKVIFHTFPIISVATKMWNNIGHVE